jgi:hypothetical protein
MLAGHFIIFTLLDAPNRILQAAFWSRSDHDGHFLQVPMFQKGSFVTSFQDAPNGSTCLNCGCEYRQNGGYDNPDREPI